MTDAIKDFWQEWVAQQLDDDPELNENFDIDSNKLEEMLLLKYFLKIFKLVIVILNLSYLFGVFWICLCEAVMDFQYDIDIETYANNNFEEEPDLFLNYFSMYARPELESLIVSTYFAFTSLSTVGLGDYHPRGDIERLCTSFMLLFGVAIFSYVMGNFIEILSEFKEFHKEIDDGDNLSRFFGILKYFNGQKYIDINLKEKIEIHFDYRWKTDKLAGFTDEEDKNLIVQLPSDVQQEIFVGFLFKDFLTTFKSIFEFPNYDCLNQPSTYSWYDYQYQKFMLELL